MPQEVTRHYVEVQGRRVHYRRSGDGPPIVMLHESPRSSNAMLLLMAYAPRGVTMLAFDTPGCGDSDPLPLARPEADDYGDALARTLELLGIDRCVVYGTHTGAAIAMALAVRHPQKVARLVIDGLGVFDGVERAQIMDSYLPPFLPQVDGTHLAWLWSRVRDQFLFFPWNHRGTGTRLWRALPEPAVLQQVALDLLRAGDNYRAPYAAAFRYRPIEWLAHLSMPVFIGARGDDMLLPHLARLGTVPSNIQIEELSADRPRWGAQLWARMLQGAVGLPTPRPAPEPALPAVRLGNSFVDLGVGRLHLRGALAGSARPLVLLHDSPGGARGMDRQALAVLGQRPVIAPDLPAHGDSPVQAGMDRAVQVARILHDALVQAGIDAADVQGVGVGACVAAALATLHPRRYLASPAAAPVALAQTVADFTPRADGGHLLAAWFHARDEYILGPLWTRASQGRHDFGDDLDLATIHQRALEALRQAPEAVVMRSALLHEARSAIT